MRSSSVRRAVVLLTALSIAACGGYGAGYGGSGPRPASPVLSSVHPSSGSTGGGEQIELAGTAFDVGTTPVVTFGGTPAVVATGSTATSITVLTPAHGEGPVDVVVTNGDGQTSSALVFTYRSPAGDAAPQVLAFDVRGSPPEGGGILKVGGLHLQATSTVTFDGTPAEVVDFIPGAPAGNDLLVVIIPGAALPAGATDGFESVVVRNPDGQSSTLPSPFSRDGTQWPANFHFGPAPHVTGFTPAAGEGLDVTVTGTDFSADAAGVRNGMRILFFGPSVATVPIRICPDATEPGCLPGVVSPSPTSVVATVPAGLLRAGEYEIVVSNFDGQAARGPGTFVVP